MFARRASGPVAVVPPGWDAVRRASSATIGWAVCMVAAAGCGSPNPRILDATEEARGMSSSQLGNEMTEQDKIKGIIAAVRRSEHVFVHDDIERNGEATANKLQLLLERDPNGVRSAREFIDRIAAPERSGTVPTDRVLLGDDQWMLARNWYHARLAELEGRPAPPIDPEQARQAEEHARRLRILDALTIVERSDLAFVSPARQTLAKTSPAADEGSSGDPAVQPRSGPKPRAKVGSKVGTKKLPMAGSKRKPKRKEYTGPQFADMLRKKWEFLGADIHDLDTFIDEIASDSFANMMRYRVILEDGREEDFGTWLRGQLEQERNKLAQGGAP